MGENKYFNIEKTNQKSAEIYIFGDITGENYRYSDADVSAVSFKKELDAVGNVKNIAVHINSGGGAVFEGIAIHNILKKHPAKVTAHVEGLAASIASVVAMAADEIHMAGNSLMMIHNAWGVFAGDYRELKKNAETLKKVNGTVKESYLSRGLRISEVELSRMMDEETWLDADTAIGLGFADKKTAALNVAASVTKEMMNRYENAPNSIKSNKNNVAAYANKKDSKRLSVVELLLSVDTKQKGDR